MYCNNNIIIITLPKLKTLEEDIKISYSNESLNTYDEIIDSLFKCLSYLHEHNIVYGILSPETIMIQSKRILFPYIYYYILNKSFYNLDNYYIIMYSSPNRLKNGEYKKSDDVWSLGCILYYLYSNKQPFYNENLTSVISNILSCNYKSLKNKAKVPEVIKTIVSLCLIENMDKRIEIGKIISEYENKNLPIELNEEIDLIELFFKEENIFNKKEIIMSISNSNSSILKLLEIYNGEKKEEYFKLLVEIILTNKNRKSFIIEKTHFDEIENIIINALCWKDYNNLMCFSDNIYKYIDSIGSKLYSILSVKQIGFSSIYLFIYFYIFIYIDCKLNDIHMIYISEIIKNLPSLETLSIWNNEITSSGLAIICQQFIYTTNLTMIDISTNKVGDVGIKKLSEYITNCVNLSALNVGATNMTDYSFKYLCDSFTSLKQISSLSLFSIYIYIYND